MLHCYLRAVKLESKLINQLRSNLLLNTFVFYLSWKIVKLAMKEQSDTDLHSIKYLLGFFLGWEIVSVIYKTDIFRYKN